MTRQSKIVPMLGVGLGVMLAAPACASHFTKVAFDSAPSRMRIAGLSPSTVQVVSSPGGSAADLGTKILHGATEARPMTLTAEESANVEAVNNFIAAWNAKDGKRAMSFFAEEARFSVGKIGMTPDFKKPDFMDLLQTALSIKMAITPGTTWARGPVVSHERVDEIILPNGRIAGKFIGVFTLRDGKIVDFIDFEF
ncbi:limonene-1,2-epoxide hydrolase [Sphingobium xenophagum]|uniref:Limonene-1,2-epoxide hydrolase n=1 Tax=Sphingobium xenophagum TaxID=121428 RepID=A0ABU1X523_SPHXE|nr:nuclear transport factor 2 family protein [Sphingobium xenophagum]MDR7156683.1 limonene-1,2-epoxide hydrolase [Sphingobium xenophagum]